jgi:hypothetical protein|tara:strand:+ start:208 stop:1254 length:1047 start_codon:yes stop_codon:yes gene_type:complete
MHNIDNINSILSAVNEINLKSKKKSTIVEVKQNSIPKLNHNLKISSDVDKLIQEAEEFKKNHLLKSQEVDLVQKNNYKLKAQSDNKIFENIQAQIIEDLYSKFKKKVKKNTLKIIFELHLKIKDLEKKLESFQFKKNQPIDKKELILKGKVGMSLKKSEPSIDNLNKTIYKNKNFLKDEIVTSLTLQDDTISSLNEKIKKFKDAEEKLLSKIIDIEQDKTLLLLEIKKFEKFKDHNHITTNTKKMLIVTYKQILKHKFFFLNIKSQIIEIKKESNVYKKNYEGLVIEINDVRSRLVTAREQNVTYENNKQDLLSSINQLNNILSKTNIIKNLSPNNKFSERNIFKDKK